MFRTMIKWLKKEFIEGYSKWEHLFMFSMVMLQIIVFIINPDSWVNIVAGMAGVISVILFAKGKISAYYIGFIQTFTYLYLSWINMFYGEVIENLFYFVTMVWGIFVWGKNMNKDTQEVKSKKFNIKQWIFCGIASLVGTIGMGAWLASIGSAQPYTDAATNIFAIIAQLLMVWCYREQWFWWLIIDLLCIKLWFVAGNWSMVAMYIAWTVNCLYGWYNWTKLEKGKEV